MKIIFNRIDQQIEKFGWNDVHCNETDEISIRLSLIKQEEPDYIHFESDSCQVDVEDGFYKFTALGSKVEMMVLNHNFEIDKMLHLMSKVTRWYPEHCYIEGFRKLEGNTIEVRLAS